MWNKKVTAVYIAGETPVVYTDLKLIEFYDYGGYGFRLPSGDVLLVSKYDRRLENNKPLAGWVFKME